MRYHLTPVRIEVIKKSAENIKMFHAKQLRNSWFDSKEDGTMMIDKTYKAGEAIDLQLPEFDENGPVGPQAVPEASVRPGDK